MATSTANTALKPTAAMATPARAGPATRATCWTMVCKAMASVMSSSATSMGSAARRAGQSTPWTPAVAAEQANRTHTWGRETAALTTSPALEAAMATWLTTRIFRRSLASASEPPQTAPASRGTSWATPIMPTTSVEWVRR